MALDDRPVLVAPDSFKGTLGASEVAAAIGRGLASRRPARRPRPGRRRRRGNDGRPARRLGGERVTVAAHDPLGREIAARFALLGDGSTAIVEVAAASGLALARAGGARRRGGLERRDGRADRGGGRARRDACAGRGRRQRDAPTAACGALEAIAAAGGLRGARLTVLCDVRTPFERAADVFAPQKGADAAAVAAPAQRAWRPSGCRASVPMTGAAGRPRRRAVGTP